MRRQQTNDDNSVDLEKNFIMMMASNFSGLTHIPKKKQVQKSTKKLQNVDEMNGVSAKKIIPISKRKEDEFVEEDEEEEEDEERLEREREAEAEEDAYHPENKMFEQHQKMIAFRDVTDLTGKSENGIIEMGSIWNSDDRTAFSLACFRPVSFAFVQADKFKVLDFFFARAIKTMYTRGKWHGILPIKVPQGANSIPPASSQLPNTVFGNETNEVMETMREFVNQEKNNRIIFGGMVSSNNVLIESMIMENVGLVDSRNLKEQIHAPLGITVNGIKNKYSQPTAVSDDTNKYTTVTSNLSQLTIVTEVDRTRNPLIETLYGVSPYPPTCKSTEAKLAHWGQKKDAFYNVNMDSIFFICMMYNFCDWIYKYSLKNDAKVREWIKPDIKKQLDSFHAKYGTRNINNPSVVLNNNYIGKLLEILRPKANPDTDTAVPPRSKVGSDLWKVCEDEIKYRIPTEFAIFAIGKYDEIIKDMSLVDRNSLQISVNVTSKDVNKSLCKQILETSSTKEDQVLYFDFDLKTTSIMPAMFYTVSDLKKVRE